MTNYSAAHESRVSMLGEEHFQYPPDHIEADNRLSWLLGRLDQAYGDDAFYVHLKRDELETARSFTKRYDRGIIRAYRGNGILVGLPEDSDPLEVSLDYCRTVNTNIELFLKDKTRTMVIELEDIRAGFERFWDAIEAEGNKDAALEELGTRHNASGSPPQKLGPRVARKVARLASGLPRYIRDA
jgi:hypothetical protein